MAHNGGKAFLDKNFRYPETRLLQGLRKLRVEIDEGHLRLAELGDRMLLTMRGSGYLSIIRCGGRFVFIQRRGAGYCAGALLADIAQHWLNPDRRGI